MDVEVDHYAVLSLPSGVEGSKLSEQEIHRAYRSKARELHPDKRRGDPDAHASFLRLQTSYELLKDVKARKLFDDQLRRRQEKLRCQGRPDSKRRKMRLDLDERERSSSVEQRNRQDEERILRKLKEEKAAISARKKMYDQAASFEEEETRSNEPSGPHGGGGELDEDDRVLEVSWEKIGRGYTAPKLREIFEEFGSVEDVVIKVSKKRGYALVVMGSACDASAAATGKVVGYLCNPLRVLPRRTASPVVSVAERSQPDHPKSSNLTGAGFRAFEESVLEKMRKAAERQKCVVT